MLEMLIAIDEARRHTERRAAHQVPAARESQRRSTLNPTSLNAAPQARPRRLLLRPWRRVGDTRPAVNT